MLERSGMIIMVVHAHPSPTLHPTSMTTSVDHDDGIVRGFAPWRNAHRSAAALLGVLGLIQIVRTPSVVSIMSADALWFAGTGLAVLLLSVINFAHIGLGPCTMPTAPVVLGANIVFALFGCWAVAVEPSLPMVIGLVAICVMLACSSVTLRTTR